MSESIKKINPTLESYSPKDKPVILSMAQSIYNENVIDVFEINGAIFELIEDNEIILAGKIAYAQNLSDEADIGTLWESVKYGQDDSVYNKIIADLTPDWSISVSIDYDKQGISPLGFMFAHVTTSKKQPQGVDTYVIPATLYVRVKSTPEAYALSDEKDMTKEVFRLFGIAKKYYAEPNGYKKNSNAPEMEWYGPNGVAYAYIPVIKSINFVED